MRVLLIGANGFIGRHVAERLLADPAAQLTALGRGDDADVRFDLAGGSPGALARFLDAVHPGVVVNCAGTTRGGARELTRHNTVAVATICEALRRSRCGARLVQVGCSSEYGPAQSGSSTAEDAVPRPGGPYGVSKLAATELVLGSDLDAVVLRVFSPAGPGTPAGSPLGRLAEAMRRSIQSGDTELRVGGLGVQRDFVDVRDVARAVHAASLSAAQGVVNIGTGRAVRLRDVAGVLARVAGFGGAVRELDIASQRGPGGGGTGSSSRPRRPRIRTPTAAAPGSRRTCAPPATASAGGPGSLWRSRSPTSGWRRHVVSDPERSPPGRESGSARPAGRRRARLRASAARPRGVDGSHPSAHPAGLGGPRRRARAGRAARPALPGGGRTAAERRGAGPRPAGPGPRHPAVRRDRPGRAAVHRVVPDGRLLSAPLPGPVRRPRRGPPPRGRPGGAAAGRASGAGARAAPGPRLRGDPGLPAGDLRRAVGGVPLVTGAGVDGGVPSGAVLPPGPLPAARPSGAGAADRPLAGGRDRLLHGPDRPRRRRGPLEALPGYWDEFVSRIGTRVSE